MSIAAIVTRGYGSGGSVHLIVVRGYGSGSTPPPTPTVDTGGAGNEDWLKVNAPRRKKKSKSTVIRFSDFDSQEAYAAALAEAAMPVAAVSDAPIVTATQDDDDFEDDDEILFAIMRMYH